MKQSMYIINPRSATPSYFGGEVFAAHGFEAGVLVADLALPTLAALAPRDFDVRIVDEHISAVDFDAEAAFVAITGKVTQHSRMVELAREFRRRGKTVLIGGPHATLAPAAVREHCDILVLGEAESVAPSLFADLASGRWKSQYQGERVDLSASPVPRWGLYPNDRALMGTLQTSRGCPYECEFCDVIQYLGRRQRHKPVAMVLEELELLYSVGYREVFLADDNFTVNRARARELLWALADWNHRRSDPVAFFTQLSVDAARDPELLLLCSRAGLAGAFIGIETPNRDSLLEARKTQNAKVDLLGTISAFVRQGIVVYGGMMVGFDQDGPDIFDQQYEFAMASPVPIFTLYPLLAMDSTPLHARMIREGRLLRSFNEGPGDAHSPGFGVNFVPKRMSAARLDEGFRELCGRLYDPEAFATRVVSLVEMYGDDERPTRSQGMPRPIALEAGRVASRFSSLGASEARAWTRIRSALVQKPRAEWAVGSVLLRYMQFRHMQLSGQASAALRTYPGQPSSFQPRISAYGSEG